MKKFKFKTRSLGIRTKILILGLVCLIIMAGGLDLLNYRSLKSMSGELGGQQAVVAANMAAGLIDGDVVASLTGDDYGSDEWNALVEQMRELKAESGVKYMYTTFSDGNNIYYGIDSTEVGGDDYSEYGTPYDGDFNELRGVWDSGNSYYDDYISYYEVSGYLITAMAPIYDSQGNVVAGLCCDYSADAIIASMNATVRNGIILSVILSVLVGIAIIVFITSITKNLDIVNRKLYDLVNNGGDLTQTIEIHSGDETELIANNINDLIAYIREIVISIHGETNTLNTSNQGMVTDLNSASHEIQGISATMEEMSATMEETAASLNQISSATDDVTQIALAVSNSAAKQNEISAEKGKAANSIYEQCISELEQIRAEADEMKTTIASRIKDSERVNIINELTEKILEITSETNLLSLNASIEAARAGEAGRGFAVVASEIGNLANNSSQIATEIQAISQEILDIVNGLASESERMVAFVEEKTVNGYDKLKWTAEQYKLNCDSVSEAMQEFMEESARLQTSMNSVNETVAAINVAVEESSNGIVAAADASSELTNSMENINSKADENSAVVNSLGLEVGKFKF